MNEGDDVPGDGIAVVIHCECDCGDGAVSGCAKDVCVTVSLYQG